ncbi:ethylene-responsive transcription factor-like protein At4g13040 [Phalaenopsis equestris]|uniref:ethylene-responsive transcription factor-like protein At4g13040 n=1 Tax=Phalaenopsis equestris TaxID=78828 RepID=UPI0009E6528E|nr:ethylene-responsive transcription factor-like protein At4g13040 [Phalaenopsis equestris]
MVSIRRRRLLGLCSGKNSIPVELPEPIEGSNAIENHNKNAKSFSIHPMPSIASNRDKTVNISETSFGAATVSASPIPKVETNNYFPVKEIKRRRRHRRKYYEDQEPCIMRGVYFKNMKWQAAIKVDKKQIHLGTVGSQEEAARLYDRAAFLCGREPNFELQEEEKKELSQYKWDEFLAITRNAITSKKHQRRGGVGRRKRSGIESQGSDIELEKVLGGTSSMSDDGEMEPAAI